MNHIPDEGDPSPPAFERGRTSGREGGVTDPDARRDGEAWRALACRGKRMGGGCHFSGVRENDTKKLAKDSYLMIIYEYRFPMVIRLRFVCSDIQVRMRAP